jgi:uncharacterized protein YcnI
LTFDFHVHHGATTMQFSSAIKFVAACAVSICASSVFAHVTLADQAALAGTTYRATLRVGHGCDGAATTAIRVSIPAGFKGAKPMPKPGWTLALSATDITWTATPGNALPDAYYDEFVLRGGLPATAGAMWFKVLQSCEKGSVDWADIPAPGTDAHSLKTPAALLEIIPSDHVGHAH